MERGWKHDLPRVILVFNTLQALAEYLSALLCMIQACKVTDQGAERQFGNGFRLRQMQEKGGLKVVKLTTPAPFWNPVLSQMCLWSFWVSFLSWAPRPGPWQWRERPGSWQPLPWYATARSWGQELPTFFSGGVVQAVKKLPPKLTLGSMLVSLAR